MGSFIKDVSNPGYMALVIYVLLSLVFSSAGDFANGQNYYCPGQSFISIMQTEPNLRARFICTSRDKAFEVVFESEDWDVVNLTNKLLDHRESNAGLVTLNSKGIGIILAANGQITQLYEVRAFGVSTLWRK